MAGKKPEGVPESGRSKRDEAPGGEECIERREALLDEALKETFPASDPPSIARPDC